MICIFRFHVSKDATLFDGSEDGVGGEDTFKIQNIKRLYIITGNRISQKIAGCLNK
jgi:hypothetical protein